MTTFKLSLLYYEKNNQEDLNLKHSWFQNWILNTEELLDNQFVRFSEEISSNTMKSE